MRARNEETICAISSPPGQGGIALIRVSGPKALENCRKLVTKLNKVKLESHKAYFSEILDFNLRKVDEVVVTYFANGKSFTGEEVVEISCHGSTYVSQKIINLLIEAGCSLANRGEFTFRAFMNNKMDLVQAESVLSLIESESELSAQIAIRQLDGYISKNLDKLESDLTWCLAHIEASIDFSTEGIDVVDNEVLLKKIIATREQISEFVKNYKSGKLIKDGIKVVLLGKPNAGKSSLLNTIVQDDKAIVTEIAGTTRDLIEATTIFEGVKFNICDTAGLRETKDQIELLGVDRSKKEAKKADIVVMVLDATDIDLMSSYQEIIEITKNEKALLIINKKDLITPFQAEEIRQKLNLRNESSKFPKKVLFISSSENGTREIVLKNIKLSFDGLEYLEQAVISSARQFEEAQYSLQMLDKTISELQNSIGAEFVAMYLKEALLSIQKILGHVYDDQILDRVFKEFCLGK